MPALEVPGGVQVRLRWTLGATAAINVLNGSVQPAFQATQTVTNALFTAIASAFTTSALAAQIHPSASLETLGLRDIRTANQPEFIASGNPVPGTGTGNPLPKQTALVVTLRTAMAGPKFRGRVYLPGFVVGASDATGTATTVVRTACRDFIVAVQAAMSAQGITLGVMHRPVWTTADPPQLVEPGFVTQVTLVQVRDGIFDVQRSRRQ